MIHHYRKTLKTYKKRMRVDSCPFCDENDRKKAVYEDDDLYVVPNLTKYDLWELHDVTEHLLLVPKRHLKSLSEANKRERSAIIDKIAEYESQGFNIYARGVGFVRRSVEHQHTHLIKATDKSPRFTMMVAKPYFLFKK